MAFRKKQKHASGHASGQVPELGAIFMSNRATKEMCFSWKTFGLPHTWESFVKQVKAGMFLFLFEHETRMLYGVYQACSDGAMDFSSDAFSSAQKDYPAQVKFKVLWNCEPLSEDVFRPAIKDNYFTANKFKFGLSRIQVKELLWLFHSRILRSAPPLEERLPGDPSLIHGATRNCSIPKAREIFIAGVQNGIVHGNENALEPNTLAKPSMPNTEARGSLLIKGDRDPSHEDALPSSINYKRELSQQHKVAPVRDRMEYSTISNNDCGLNPAIPYMSTERYDPDNPLVNNMQQFREDGKFIWEGRTYTDNILDAPNITRQLRFSTGMHHDARDRSLNPLSYYSKSVPNSFVEKVAYAPRQSSEICYFEPSSYIPVSGTSLQGQGRCSEAHSNPEAFRVMNNNNNANGELLKDLSGNIFLPSEIDDASILRQHVAYCDPSQTLHRTVDITNDSKVRRESPAPQNKPSVFSRLKPALKADDECELKDPQKSISDMVNEVMENLSGHYHQLIRKSISPIKHDDGSENNNIKNEVKMKKPRTSHSGAANYEPVASMEMVFDASTDNKECETETGRQVIGKIPRLNFKRRSEMHKKRNAYEGGLTEMSSAISPDKKCKRRKLVRPILSEKKLPNKDDMPDKSSENLSSPIQPVQDVADKNSENLSSPCQPVQDESFKTEVPLSHDRQQVLPVSGNLGSNFVGNCGIVQSETEKLEGHSLPGSSESGTQQLPEVLDVIANENSSGQNGNANIDVKPGCLHSNLGQKFDASADYNSSEQYGNANIDVKPGCLDLNLGQKFDYSADNNSSGQYGNASIDIKPVCLDLNLGQKSDDDDNSNGQFGNANFDVKPVCLDLNVGDKIVADGDEGVSTKLELWQALNVGADSCKSVEQVGTQPDDSDTKPKGLM